MTPASIGVPSRPMNRTHTPKILTLSLLACLAACAPKPPAAVDAGTDITAIAASANALQLGFNNRNPSAVAAMYTRDAQLLPPGAPIIRGQDAIRKHYAAEMTGDSLPPQIVTADTVAAGDWGWRAGTWRISSLPPVSGKFVEVWRRSPEGWRIYRDIYNLDATPPATP